MEEMTKMSLRASILKLRERLENDIDHYESIEDSIGLYEVGKMNEMRKINEYLIVSLETAENAGRNVG